MEFKKFSEIDNTRHQKCIDYLAEQGLIKGYWSVSEKIHGSNFSLHYDGQELRAAKRTSFLDENENFYGCLLVVAKHKENVIALYDYIKSTRDCVQVSVYGEIFGGKYPHKDVLKVGGSVAVQNGIYYAPFDGFYAFDLKVDNEYLGVHEANELFEKFGFFYAKPLFEGSFEDCLKYPNEFQTTIPALLGLPEIPENFCEGVVIRPLQIKRFISGERVILKNKNEKWSENNVHEPRVKTEITFSEQATKVVYEIKSLITENRLRNVISKIGQITQKDFGMLLGQYTKDIFEEYNKDNENALENLDKEEHKRINKLVSQLASNVVRTNFVNIIDNTF